MQAPENLPELMARCFAYLESQGIGPLELAAMSLEDTTAIAKQLAFEMNIPYGGYLDEAVETCLRGAKEERELLQRARSVYGTVLDWHLLQPTSSSSSATEVTIPKPDPGERPTHTRGPVMESADRKLERATRDLWGPSASYLGVKLGSWSGYCYVGRENESYDAETLRDSFPTMAAVAVGS